jgi:hypothetical protein
VHSEKIMIGFEIGIQGEELEVGHFGCEMNDN